MTQDAEWQSWMGKFEKFLILRLVAQKDKKRMPRFEAEVSSSKLTRGGQTEVIGIFFPTEKCPLFRMLNFGCLKRGSSNLAKMNIGQYILNQCWVYRAFQEKPRSFDAHDVREYRRQ